MRNEKGIKKSRETGNRQAKDKLREAELLYHTLFNQSPDGILIIDTDGHIVEFNEAAHRQLGYNREEFKGLHLSDVDPFQRPEEITAQIEKVVANGSDEFEVRHRTKTGDLRDVLVITRLMSLSGRTVFHTIWRDITDQRRMETVVLKSEIYYRSLIEQASDGIAVIDREGRYLDVNSCMCKMMGYSREDFLKLSIQDILLHEEIEAKPLKLSNLLAGETVISERLMRRKDGSAFPMEISARMLPDGKLCGIHRDITERKRMEEALRRSEEFIRDILETVDEGFIVIDRDYRILSANKAYLDQVKLPLGEVLGRHCYEISHHIGKPCYELGEKCSVKHAFDKGEPSTALHIHHDRENNPVYVETKSYPLKDASGHTVSAIEIILNTTEKKRLEDQLRHAQKMEAVGQLAGGIAHDFNNILTAITGYGSLMAAKMNDDDPLRSYLQQVLDSAQRAAKLTQGLLTFSRKQIISPKPVSINQIIGRVEKLLQRLIGEDIEVKTSLSGEDLVVTADSSQMEQVLMNLATNARDAMPEGGYLTITTERYFLDAKFKRTHGYGTPGTYVLITVSDTGLGMDNKTKEKIFEPFFTTKEVGKGTGLGLSIVYGIIKQHEGFINCYSEPGKGSTFRIYLPTISREAATLEANIPHRATGGRETVLVAEDDDTVRALVKEVLEQAGYTVIEATDGEAAVSVFAKNRERVQLLILDVIMPKMNGREACDVIRKDRPGVKVIFSSGYTADILHKKGIIEGEASFISKPVAPAELLRLVRMTLDKDQRA